MVNYPWKLLYRPLHPEHNELFDLTHDPKELENRFSSEPAQALLEEKLLAAHGGFVTTSFATVDGAAIDADSARRALERLGYVGATGHDARFSFVCPEHPSEYSTTPVPCPRCSAPKLPVARSR